MNQLFFIVITAIVILTAPRSYAENTATTVGGPGMISPTDKNPASSDSIAVRSNINTGTNRESQDISTNSTTNSDDSLNNDKDNLISNTSIGGSVKISRVSSYSSNKANIIATGKIVKVDRENSRILVRDSAGKTTVFPIIDDTVFGDISEGEDIEISK